MNLKLTKDNKKILIFIAIIAGIALLLNSGIFTLSIIDSNTFATKPSCIVSSGSSAEIISNGYTGTCLRCSTSTAGSYAYAYLPLSSGHTELYCEAKIRVTGTVGPLEFVNIMEFLTDSWEYPIRVRVYGEWYGSTGNPVFGILTNGEDHDSMVSVTSGQWYTVALYVNSAINIAKLYINGDLAIDLPYTIDSQISIVNIGIGGSGVSSALSVDVDDYSSQDVYPTSMTTFDPTVTISPPTDEPTATPTPTDVINPPVSATPTITNNMPPNSNSNLGLIILLLICVLVVFAAVLGRKKS